LHTPVVSSQLLSSSSSSQPEAPGIPGSLQPSPASNSAEQTTGRFLNIPGTAGSLPAAMRAPPPLGAPFVNNFVPAAISPYTAMTTNSTAPSSQTRPPQPHLAFTVPPPRVMPVAPPTSLTIAPPGLLDFPSSSSTSASSLSRHSFPAPSPSSSKSAATTGISPAKNFPPKPLIPATNATARDSTDPATSSGNGTLRHQDSTRKRSAGDFDARRLSSSSFGGYRDGGVASADGGSGDDRGGRGDMRDPRRRERDRSSQEHENGGRRYSSDNRTITTRFRDYDRDNNRNRRYEPPPRNSDRR
uniref:FDF domain-containing protein n=1 Tax=Gongylonema pulchrum TaxID=637853 RepID=A0A183EPK5_9BILA